MKSSFCRTKCKSFLTPACTVMDKWYGWKVEEQEDKMLNLESALVSRFQGDLVPEPEWQTLLVLAGVQEEYFKGYEDNWNTIFSVVDLTMGQQWRGMGHEQSGAARLGCKKHPPKKPSIFVQAKPEQYKIYGAQRTWNQDGPSTHPLLCSWWATLG